MQYRFLGKSGLRVSLVGIGCNVLGGRVDQAAANAIVEKAVELGVTFFDTADIYGGGRSEEILGAAIKPHRHNMIIATKAAWATDGKFLGASRRHLIQAVEASLRRLDTDYIDVYQIHYPDRFTPIEETLSALDDLVRSGRVRYLGMSNYSAWEAVEADWTARTHHLTPFVSTQNEYNILWQDVRKDVIRVAGKYGFGVLPYSPLANGFLTGKYRPGQEPPEGTRLGGTRGGTRRMASRILTDDNFEMLLKLEDFAASRGHTMLDLAMGWLATQPEVSSVIAGATSPEQLEANVKAGEWILSAQEMKEVDDLTTGFEWKGRLVQYLNDEGVLVTR